MPGRKMQHTERAAPVGGGLKRKRSNSSMMDPVYDDNTDDQETGSMLSGSVEHHVLVRFKNVIEAMFKVVR